ncbi:MAG TPA: hypothetical protein VF548_05285 [Allosphingosinicella sp.]
MVGADPLPSSGTLYGGVIQVNRGYGEVSEGFLSYELRPDGVLAVIHSDRAGGGVLGEDRFHLAPEIADQARRRLWRLRPARLEGVDAHEARPLGCKRRGPHDFGEVAIVFIDQGISPGSNTIASVSSNSPAPKAAEPRKRGRRGG